MSPIGWMVMEYMSSALNVSIRYISVYVNLSMEMMMQYMTSINSLFCLVKDFVVLEKVKI